ncbi:MAG TPA: ABC transporter ATP-binding protein [Planctomycetota bacterium]|jgi:iron(III) transport system ATP-binding protein|nr:ABC transporter ATP-binding protein [Planctomycetota bacterium]
MSQTPPSSPSGLWVRDLCVGSPSARRLDSVSFSLDPGESLAVLGPSGGGKTTLIRSIAGLLSDIHGHVGYGDHTWHRGERSLTLPEHRGLGFVPQDLALWPHMTAAQHLDFVLKARGKRGTERTDSIRSMLDLVGLGALAARKPPQLSGGEGQRLALARALVGDCRVLLLDEPLGHLDEALRRPLARRIAELAQAANATVLHVTHDLADAMSHSHRIAVLEAGVLVQLATPIEILNAPRTRFVARVTGRTNIIPPHLTADFLTALGTTLPLAVPLSDGSLAFSPTALSPSPSGLPLLITGTSFEYGHPCLRATWNNQELSVATDTPHLHSPGQLLSVRCRD